MSNSTDTPVNEFDFSDLSVREIKNIRISGKTFTLREASEDAAVHYRNEIFRSTKLGESGRPVSMDGIANAEPLLLSYCLIEDSSGLPVALRTILAMPTRIVEPLVKKLKEISDLGDADPIRDAIKAAFNRGDAPITLQTFKEFLAKIPESDKEIGPLVRLFKGDVEIKAKNLPDNTAASSD